MYFKVALYCIDRVTMDDDDSVMNNVLRLGYYVLYTESRVGVFTILPNLGIAAVDRILYFCPETLDRSTLRYRRKKKKKYTTRNHL